MTVSSHFVAWHVARYDRFCTEQQHGFTQTNDSQLD